MDRNWELYDLLLETIGADELCLSLCKALSSDDMNSCLLYIADCFEIKEYEE